MAVTTHALTRRYGRHIALHQVDLRVPEGAVYVLAGANGAGKTTLLKVLMNLERAHEGTAEVFGLDSWRRGPQARARVGYVPERPEAAHGGMTCRQLLRHVATCYPAWDDAYMARLVQAFGLRMEARAAALSKGELRKLQLVMAMAHRPPLLLLDEPTDGLDPVIRQRTLSLLAEHLADTPTTILLATHQIHEMESLADHLGALREGRLVSQMPREVLHRTLRRYRVELPDEWHAPPGFPDAEERRGRGSREVQWTLRGEEQEMVDRLVQAGARVRDVRPLALEEAAITLLSEGSP